MNLRTVLYFTKRTGWNQEFVTEFLLTTDIKNKLGNDNMMEAFSSNGRNYWSIKNVNALNDPFL